MSDDHVQAEAQASLAADLLEVKIPAQAGDTSPSIDDLLGDADHTQVEAALRRFGRDLAQADPLKRALERERAIGVLNKLAIVKSAARLVDAALGVEARQEQAGTALTLEDPAAWDDPVDGDLLAAEILSVFNRYAALPAGAAEILSIFVMSTYAVDSFDHAAYLAVVSPTKRCGKTTVQRLATALVRRPLQADNISPAALYRSVEAVEPTLLVDELDRLPPDSDLWQVLNSGHSRGGCVYRCEGESNEPRAFRTFGPKVLSYIRTAKCPVPDTVEDRSIIITMQRRAKSESGERLRSRTLAEVAAPLRRKLVRWSEDSSSKLACYRPALPDDLDDRSADTWESLLAVADLCGVEWGQRLRALAITYSAGRAEDEAESPAIGLLSDLGTLIETGTLVADDLGGIAAEEMVRLLRKLPDRPWRTWGRRGDGLTVQALGRLLKPLEIRSVMMGPETRRRKRYAVDPIRAAVARYIPSPVRFPVSLTSSQEAETAAVRDSGAKAVSMCGSEPHSQVPQRVPIFTADPAVYQHRGHGYRVGDRLPDGRRIESMEFGVPVLVRPRTEASEEAL